MMRIKNKGKKRPSGRPPDPPDPPEGGDEFEGQFRQRNKRRKVESRRMRIKSAPDQLNRQAEDQDHGEENKLDSSVIPLLPDEVSTTERGEAQGPGIRSSQKIASNDQFPSTTHELETHSKESEKCQAKLGTTGDTHTSS